MREDVTIDSDDTAVVFTDPQITVLKLMSVMWDKARDIAEEDTVERLTD